MDRWEIIELLDMSCAKALDAWWEMDARCKERSRAAMKALADKLGSLTKPDYDSKYLPPAYVIRYQISHILMAWKSLSLSEEWLWTERDCGIVNRSVSSILEREHRLDVLELR